MDENGSFIPSVRAVHTTVLTLLEGRTARYYKSAVYLLIPSRAVGTTVAQYLRVGPHGTEGEASPLPGTTFFFPKMHASAPFYAVADAPGPQTMRKGTAALQSDRLRRSQRDLRR